MENVLVIGATGNIGVAAVLGALQSKRHVLAIVRNQASADKLFKHVGTKNGITTVEADIMSEGGVQTVVDQVRAGKLPDFQHVYSAAGGAYGATSLTELSLNELRQIMSVNFESNFFAYRATIPYLLEQKKATSFTLCTGAQGDIGARAAPAISQGPLFSMANVACRDNTDSSVRFNEVYLNCRVEVDSSAAKTGAMKSSDFARSYTELLSRPEIKSSRIIVSTNDDLEDLKHKKKIA
ncbi:putative short-chain dehydrogenase reductase sdr protein [Botrytis fragariae]|uniref:Putative short-chain dehydrogenase reductase sdr protein n=1 Tax=Botrytis fragariae TaxID=1964551 RepID=A0A8H6ALM9_9HELO|nr:putative short-chain dehydrogenase reductase sdr protein [Botrytis fragariae]KAF5869563.1 putative short-chain dehydrogenase reductase sdr protein [Botrytis fragariae]